MYVIETVRVNETQGYQWSDDTEPVEDWLLNDDGTPDFGHIYRLMQREYGRCQSSVYVDTDDGARRIGWFFVKREHYDDTGEPFLAGTWITLLRLVEPARPAMYESVTVPGSHST